MKKTGLPKLGVVIDWETSGYSPPSECEGHFIGYSKKHQGISLGAVIFNVNTFDAVDTFYVEIKFDPKYEWSPAAENIHKLSRDHLEQNGKSHEDAAVLFLNFLLKYFLPDEELLIMGHNKDFDISFLHQFLDPLGIMPKISYRGVNTSDIGIVCFGLCRSDQIFDFIGLESRTTHNSLDDALKTLEVCRVVKLLINTALKNE